jgi:glycosyltransferase involved in cell wall biosynthesis
MTPKISIITATYNSVSVVGDCLASVAAQSHSPVEHVVVDGASTDGTLTVLQAHREQLAALISEPDNGIYHALNKGFSLASGDVIGILHSDDVFIGTNVLAEVAEAFKNPSVDYVYGDIKMVRSDGSLARYWNAGRLRNGRITQSQLPHPALFISRRLMRALNPVFDTSYQIAADLKQQLIFANKLQANGVYIARALVRMRVGGKSTANVSSFLNGWRESRRAWNEVHGRGGTFFVLKKVLSKFSGIRVF